MKVNAYGSLVLLVASVAACVDAAGGSGQLRVVLAAEETIDDGLKAGPDPEDTKDFGVTYTKYLAVLGAVKVARTAPARALATTGVFIADMRQVGQQGVPLATFDHVQAGQWDQFGFATPAALPGYQTLAGATDADAQLMIEKQWTYWIEGTVNRPGKPVSFVLQLAVPTVYTDCESNGQPGVSVSEGGVSTATITLHGDHLWFDSLVAGYESTVVRRTQWLVDADTDGDGKVVTEDLAKLPAETAFPSSKGYNLSGGAIPIANALDFVRAQLATQGHFNGEGACQPQLL